MSDPDVETADALPVKASRVKEYCAHIGLGSLRNELR
jgi:hypothetical protein